MKKYIYVNLKRFDILRKLGGVNDLPITTSQNWIEYINLCLNDQLKKYSEKIEFVFFVPESYLMFCKDLGTIKWGCQSIHFEDVSQNNIGAFTTLRTATAMKSVGIDQTIIGHSEERKYLHQIMSKVCSDEIQIQTAVQKILLKKILIAQSNGMKVLYCIGETAQQRDQNVWKKVVKQQLNFDLLNNKFKVDDLKIAYEPIWAIGPNRPVPTIKQIDEVGQYIHCLIGNMIPVLYGGGLKKENAAEIGSLMNINGGLVALTAFNQHVGFYPEQFEEIVSEYARRLS